MKRVIRCDLTAREINYLDRRANDLALRGADNLPPGAINQHWRISRQTRTLNGIFDKLRSMMGPFERCMYCLDSHGCDIEHFKPKASYNESMYTWNNLLLCCTECGRLKGSKFPMDGAEPLLIDPTGENPWDHLSFDPRLDTITASFDLASNTFDKKGTATVELLNLDRREALQHIYRRAYRRLTHCITQIIDAPPAPDEAVDILIEEDVCGLLGWMFGLEGERISPMLELKEHYVGIWDACHRKFVLMA
ncbi:hypothetical protein [Paracoccus sanguinis]|uniref:hypothetical protein n=1 Tax=Paracoccus sanguinis TaxID=1545044 RepID=UPI0014516B5C|nr:hypothetical protein [Paracoccus sanguinis]QJD17980.1 hypothetical protein HGN31_14670 [Paracoccus sanguinis]